ncbi:MAG: formylglycine-generating enzyme family protein, partial [Xenococcus sp. (in: cyanobacteria)]
ILDAEISKIEQAKQNYQELLEATIADGLNPLDPANQQELKSLQQYLKLTDEEVAEISNLVLSDGETNKQVDATNKPERVIHIHQGNYNETIQGDYYDTNRSSDLDSSNKEKSIKPVEIAKPKDIKEPEEQKTLETGSRIQKFSFEVITVDDTGKENSRKTREAEFYQEDLGNNMWLDMVKIPGGEFMMGSPEGEGRSNEKPQHKVRVPSFWLGKYPVTQAQWQEIMGNNPSNFQDYQYNPVEQVSWDDAQKFCQQLSQKTGNKYRLPSEAEWEYACRAGTTTPFYFGLKLTPQLAQCKSNFGMAWITILSGKTCEVGQFYPNNFGLYDMHGNVWEWCADDWHENYHGAPNDGTARLSKESSKKIRRGGSWSDEPNLCRSAYRDDFTRGSRSDSLGFRVVCVAPRAT